MDFWLPFPRRAAVEYGKKRQKFVIALSSDQIVTLAALNHDVPDFSTIIGDTTVDWFECKGKFYRHVYYAGSVASVEQLREAEPKDLFYSWASPTSLAWQDHPSAVNVTFEPESPLKYPIPDVSNDLKFALGRQTAFAYLDADRLGTQLGEVSQGCRTFQGHLVREAQPPTAAIHIDANDRLVRVAAEGLDDPNPFSVHFGLEQEEQIAAFVHLLWRADIGPSGNVNELHLPSAEAAARSTLISATAAVRRHIGRQNIERVSLAQIELLRLARDALTEPDGDPAETVLQTFVDRLDHSTDPKLQRIATVLRIRRRVLEEPREVTDPDLERALNG